MINNVELREEFPSNSNKKKKEEEKETIKKVEKVVTGKVITKKKSFGKKMAGLFLEDTTKTVGEYITHDVLIPAAKSMICDIVGWGGFAEMLLFGGKKGNRTRRDGGRSYTSYGSMYNSKTSIKEYGRPVNRDVSSIQRARHDFEDIVLESRGEAEEVLSHLVDLTLDYGVASVSDFYELVGVKPEHVDSKYGWFTLEKAYVSRVRDGYLITLPRTVPID